MSDYRRYRESVGITTTDMIRALHEVYPQFSKIHSSYIHNPEKHGMKLTAEAEQLLAEKFGFGKGLDIKPSKKREVKRNKTRRLAVRIDERHYDMVKNKMQQMGCESVQSFLELLVNDAIRKEHEDEKDRLVLP